MNKKDMLKKLFLRFGEEGARNPSPRGCYEMPVPENLRKQVLEGKRLANRSEKR